MPSVSARTQPLDEPANSVANRLGYAAMIVRFEAVVRTTQTDVTRWMPGGRSASGPRSMPGDRRASASRSMPGDRRASASFRRVDRIAAPTSPNVFHASTRMRVRLPAVLDRDVGRMPRVLRVRGPLDRGRSPRPRGQPEQELLHLEMPGIDQPMPLA